MLVVDTEWGVMTLGMTSLPRCSLIPFLLRDYSYDSNQLDGNELYNLIHSDDFNYFRTMDDSTKPLTVIQVQ